jgi:hypothetical protein
MIAAALFTTASSLSRMAAFTAVKSVGGERATILVSVSDLV